MPKIYIQGVRASFHEIAAHKFFGELDPVELAECELFREIFEHLSTGEDSYGVMAIENTLAGSILPNYSLLLQNNLQIIGEVYLRIRHTLLGVADADIANLKEVHSHPMAILQCLKFFKAHPHIRLVESIDTALSAKELAASPRKDRGVIASHLASGEYGLNILAEGIETNERNFTRFLILRHASHLPKTKNNSNKASVSFRLSHEAGSLAKVLTRFSQLGINLSKIQSLPVIGKEWEYLFLVDCLYEKESALDEALKNETLFVEPPKVWGKYRSGIKHRTL